MPGAVAGDDASGGEGPDVRLHRSLVVLADELHVGRAAARLHLTQPALSKHLAQLERSTGLVLFDRHPRRISPTDAGRLLIERTRHIIREVDAFDVLAARARRALTGRLMPGFVGQAANELTPELLRAYRQAYPDVTVELRQHDLSDLSAGLSSGASDLALLRMPVTAPTGSPPLVHEPVFIEARVAVLPTGHRLAGQAAAPLADLLGEPWVVRVSPDPVYQDFALETAARSGTLPCSDPASAPSTSTSRWSSPATASASCPPPPPGTTPGPGSPTSPCRTPAPPSARCPGAPTSRPAARPRP